MTITSRVHCRACGRFVPNPRNWCTRRPCCIYQEQADAMADRWRRGQPNGWDLFLASRFGTLPAWAERMEEVASGTAH